MTIEQELRRIIEENGGIVKMDDPSWMVARIRAMFGEQKERLIKVAVRNVENHCCVSTCCDAQPGGTTAEELARCLKQSMERALQPCNDDCICACHDYLKGPCHRCAEAQDYARYGGERPKDPVGRKVICGCRVDDSCPKCNPQHPPLGWSKK